VTAFSALPGCYILGLLGVMVLGFGGWGVYTLVRQSRALETFTATAPAALAAPAPTDEAVAALRAKLGAFRDSAAAGKEASVTLDVGEINTLLGGFASLAEIRPLLVCREIGSDGALTAEVSLPLNSFSGRRFLNGRFLCRVAAHDTAGLFIAVTDVQVPGKAIPAGFVDVYQRGIVPGKTFGFLDDMLLRNFRADPEAAATLAAIKRVTSAPGVLTLSTAPATATPAPAPAARESGDKGE
jgi:hypothetical protein